MVLSRSLSSAANFLALPSTSLPLIMSGINRSRSTSAALGAAGSPATATPQARRQPRITARSAIDGDLHLVGGLELAIELGRLLLHAHEVLAHRREVAQVQVALDQRRVEGLLGPVGREAGVKQSLRLDPLIVTGIFDGHATQVPALVP